MSVYVGFSEPCASHSPTYNHIGFRHAVSDPQEYASPARDCLRLTRTRVQMQKSHPHYLLALEVALPPALAMTSTGGPESRGGAGTFRQGDMASVGSLPQRDTPGSRPGRADCRVVAAGPGSGTAGRQLAALAAPLRSADGLRFNATGMVLVQPSGLGNFGRFRGWEQSGTARGLRDV